MQHQDIDPKAELQNRLLSAIAAFDIKTATTLLKNGAILALDETLVAHQITALIEKCKSYAELTDFLETLTKCGLTDLAIIQLLPKKFISFENEHVKEEILAAINEQMMPEDKVKACEDALNRKHPVGYIIQMERKWHEWGANKGIITDINDVLKKSKAYLAKMQDEDDLEMEFLRAVEDKGILFRLNDPTADRNLKEKNIFDAVLSGDLDLIDKMLKQDEKVLDRWRNSRGQGPLHVAILKGEVDLVKHLLDRGAHINDKNKHHETPLHLAIQEKNLEMVQLLLQRGANYRSAFDRAAISLHPAILKIFLDMADNETHKRMLPCICRSMRYTDNGLVIIELLETMQNYYRRSWDIINAVREAFDGCCEDALQLSIVQAIRHSNEKFDKRLADARSWEHPLGHFMCMNTRKYHIFFKTDSIAQKQLETLTRAPSVSADEMLSDFVLLDASPSL